MTSSPQKRFRSKVSRFTLLDACGTPVHGPVSTLVTKGIIKITLTPVYENPTDYLLRNANDELEVNEQGAPPLRWYEAEVELITVDPQLINMWTGAPLVVDDSGNFVGWRGREGVNSQVAIEGWTDLAGQPCAAGQKPYGYWVTPYLVNPQIQALTYENAAATLSVKAHTHNFSLWGVGPYPIRNGSGGPTGLQQAIQPLDHYHTEVTTLAPPTPTAGAVLLP